MSFTSMGAAVPEPPDDGNPHHPATPWYHKKGLTPYEQHVLDKYFEDQRREAAKAKKRAEAARHERIFGETLPHRGTDFFRDPKGKWTAAMPEPRLDWMNLDFDLMVKEIIALDLETGDDMVYRRLQSSASDECRWVGEGDLVTPEGHSSEQLMGMWPSGFRVIKQFTPGWEPPHSCPTPSSEPCMHCRFMNKVK